VTDSRNLDLVRSIYANWARGDFTEVAWADPEFELVFAGGPSPGTWRGIAEARQGMRDFVAAWRNFRVRAEEYRELDAQRVLVLSDLGGAGRTSGLTLAQMGSRASELFEIRGEKVVRIVIYWDRDDAFADLGLDPD
jgi:ketosteroid isomerase-like protein